LKLENIPSPSIGLQVSALWRVPTVEKHCCSKPLVLTTLSSTLPYAMTPDRPWNLLELCCLFALFWPNYRRRNHYNFFSRLKIGSSSQFRIPTGPWSFGADPTRSWSIMELLWSPDKGAWQEFHRWKWNNFTESP